MFIKTIQQNSITLYRLLWSYEPIFKDLNFSYIFASSTGMAKWRDECCTEV